jgi:hypothetical protein
LSTHVRVVSAGGTSGSAARVTGRCYCAVYVGGHEKRHEDDWEKSRDVETGLAPAADIDAEAVDLDAYVRQLYAETAAAEPAIPTHDLGALSVEADDDLALWTPAEAPLSETPNIDPALEFDSFAAALEMPPGPKRRSKLNPPFQVWVRRRAGIELNCQRSSRRLSPPVPTAGFPSSLSTAHSCWRQQPIVWSASSPTRHRPRVIRADAIGSDAWFGMVNMLSAIGAISISSRGQAPSAPVSQPLSRHRWPLSYQPAGGWAQSTDAPAVEPEEASSTDRRLRMSPTAPAPVALLPTLATLEAALSATLEVRMPTPATVVEAPSRAPVEVLALAALEAARPATIETLPVFKPLPTLEEAEAAISAVVFQGKAPDRVAVPVVGSWGFFDPQHLELGALLAKLNELSQDASHTHRVGR